MLSRGHSALVAPNLRFSFSHQHIRHVQTMAVEAREAKKAQRAALKTKLATLSEGEVDVQSEKAQDVILSLSQYQNAKRVGIYLSMPTGEAQTSKLVRNALEHDKKVFVPYIYPVGDAKPKKKVMDMLRLESIEEYEGLERDSWGIPKLPREGRELRENAIGGTGLSFSSEGIQEDGKEVAGLDLIVVPAVAFDRDMNRMGHGAGFYDQYLSRFCAGNKRAKPFLVGLCLPEQIVGPGQLVMQEWDWKVDAVAVGDGSLLASEDTQ